MELITMAGIVLGAAAAGIFAKDCQKNARLRKLENETGVKDGKVHAPVDAQKEKEINKMLSGGNKETK